MLDVGRFIGYAGYHLGRIAHYSGVVDSSVEAALRYAPLAIVPAALFSKGSTVQRGNTEKGFAIINQGFVVAWALSASLMPSRSALLPSSLPSSLYSCAKLFQIGTLAASKTETSKKIFYLICLLDLPIATSIFCPRLMSGLYLAGTLHTLWSAPKN